MRAPTDGVAARIEALIGKKVRAFHRVEGGYTPAGRWICATDRFRCFAKVGTTRLTSMFLRNEIAAYAAIQAPFMPRVLGSDASEEEPILLLEDLGRADWPPPWTTARVDQTVETIAALHELRADVPDFAGLQGNRGKGWEAVADDPEPLLALGMCTPQWLEHALPILVDQELRAETGGDATTHWDLRSDNLCFAPDGVKIIDWNNACRSNATLDLGFWLPSLHFEGGPPPEAILPDAPAIAAWVSGFFAARAGLPQVPDAPRVRQVQHEQLTTALPWAARALDLPPVDQR